MSQNPNNALREEFEVLLGRYLWGDLTVTERYRLLELLEADESFRDDFRFCGSIDHLLSEPGILEIPAGESEPVLGNELHDRDTSSPRILSFPERFSRSKPILRNTILAAASLLIAFGALYRIQIGFDSEKGAQDRLVFAQGSCLANGKKMEVRTELSERVIQSGNDSICDLLFQRGYTVRIRMFPESSIVSRRSATRLIVALQKGDILVDVSRIKPGEELQLLAPGNLIRFLGTRVYLRQQSTGATQIEVVSGKVEVRSGNLYHMPRLVLGASDQKQKLLVRTAPVLFREKTRIVSRGKYLIVAEDLTTGGRKRAVLQKLESRILNQKNDPGPHLKNWLKELTPATRKALDQKKTRVLRGEIDTRRRKQLLGSLAKTSGRPVQKSPRKTSKGKRIQHGTVAGDQPLQSAKKIRESDLQLIYLRNGTLLRGRIYQEGDEYIVQSETGKRRLRRREIEKIVQE